MVAAPTRCGSPKLLLCRNFFARAEVVRYSLAVLHRAFRCRLYPTPEQASVLTEHVNAVRFVYNLALEQRRYWWRQYQANVGKVISFASQCRELTLLRDECEWLRAAPRDYCEQALRDLDAAFAAFYAKRAGYPTFRKRGQSDSFRTRRDGFGIQVHNKKWCTLRLARGVNVKMRVTQPIVGEVRSVTVSEKGGVWYASVLAIRDPVEVEKCLDCVGIDRGVANTISLTTGQHFQMPTMARRVRSRKRAQKALSRCEENSRRRALAKRRLASRSAAVAAGRKQWLHERSTEIAQHYGTVTLEALNIGGMSARGRSKRGINRSILEQGWGMFAAMLEYKLAERGGRVEYVNPAYTSQTCSACGCVARENRKSQAIFECVDCGHSDHADTNAALNILRRSPSRVEGTGCGLVEAQSRAVLTHRENLAA